MVVVSIWLFFSYVMKLWQQDFIRNDDIKEIEMEELKMAHLYCRIVYCSAEISIEHNKKIIRKLIKKKYLY